MTEIDFYYWGFQCPYNSWIIDLLKGLNKEKFKVNLLDVTNNHALAESVNMFSPTLLIFNKNFRWNGPIGIKTIEDIGESNFPRRNPFSIKLGTKIFRGSTAVLSPNNISCIKECCSPESKEDYCHCKGKWLKEIKEKFNLPHLGILNFDGDRCVGGAEFVPSAVVPYDIPKNDKTAFLTCSYLSDEEWDYRSYPLSILEKELRSLGYNYIEAVASEEVVFPNGTLAWFMQKGYEDMGELYYEEESFARMHLVKKRIYE